MTRFTFAAVLIGCAIANAQTASAGTTDFDVDKLPFRHTSQTSDSKLSRYHFRLPYETKVVIKGAASWLEDPSALLFRQRGAQREFITFDDDSGPWRDFEIVKTLEPGVYQLEAETRRTGNLTVTIEFDTVDLRRIGQPAFGVHQDERGPSAALNIGTEFSPIYAGISSTTHRFNLNLPTFDRVFISNVRITGADAVAFNAVVNQQPSRFADGEIDIRFSPVRIGSHNATLVVEYKRSFLGIFGSGPEPSVHTIQVPLRGLGTIYRESIPWLPDYVGSSTFETRYLSPWQPVHYFEFAPNLSTERDVTIFVVPNSGLSLTGGFIGRDNILHPGQRLGRGFAHTLRLVPGERFTLKAAITSGSGDFSVYVF